MSGLIGKTKEKKSNIDSEGTLRIPAPKNIGNKEHYQRLNYLIQSSAFLSAQINDTDESLSRNYMKNMDAIRKKNQLALSPQVKRQVCKKCHRLLVPGRNLEMRIMNNTKKIRKRDVKAIRKSDILTYQCACGERKNFPIGKDPAYQLHLEKPGNLISI
ncbi:unnamed protein product [Kluyveromyces dobzhanskii CBS 2104]|uniref:WGS project CCBQ000000000 data, contig 00012 n=1 Tax=Kluyveromyces dobzhanskii CBS 2104 TaxID=1427455 RepID=A0A0A8L2R7_9SACH|nr:unnamed protein product [Kluyveromyces dobzhanskii CBS 2104]